MEGLTGLSGLAGMQVLVDGNSQATPAERSGDTADPRHDGEWNKSRPYPWQSQIVPGSTLPAPKGVDNQMLGDEYWFMTPAGNETQNPLMDRTPSRRAAPWPKGILSGPVPSQGPEDVAEQRRQSYLIHAVDAGASRAMTRTPDGWVQQDDWREIDTVDSGHTDVRPIGNRQNLSSGFMFGTRDRVQSMAGQNSFGFDSHHLHRRYAAGSIPGNYYWMRPGGRPLVKMMAGPARPAIGPDSPFEGDDLGAAFGIDGAILQTPATEYIPPPQPYLAPNPTIPEGDTGEVEWY